MDIKLHDQNLVRYLEADTEEDFIERIIREAIRVTKLFQIIFKSKFRFECLNKGGYQSGVALNIKTWNEVKKHQFKSKFDAIESIVTPELISAFGDKFGPLVASSLSNQVRRRVREILEAEEREKKRDTVKSKPIIVEEPTKRALEKLRRERDLRDSEPRYLDDDEPGVTFENAYELSEFKTVADIHVIGEAFLARKAHFAEIEREFLGEPEREAKTIQFHFTQGMGERKGEKKFRPRPLTQRPLRLTSKARRHA